MSEQLRFDIPESRQGIKPPIKWVGGKKQFLPRIAKLYRASGAAGIIEPFCGGLSVSLGVRPDWVIANDINTDLINFWRQCQRAVPTKWNCGTVEVTESEFYRMRDNFNSPRFRNPRSRAVTFYELLKTCHGGLCRYNQQGQFNSPYGRYKNINWDYGWESLAIALQDFRFFNLPWNDFLIEVNDRCQSPSTLIFADPPYHGTFDYGSGFNWDSQVILAEYLASVECPVIVTNSWHDDIVALYQSFGFFQIEKVERRGGFNNKAKTEKTFEMFAWNF